MIWKLSEIISNLSLQYELHPGDLIYTGTPRSGLIFTCFMLKTALRAFHTAAALRWK